MYVTYYRCDLRYSNALGGQYRSALVGGEGRGGRRDTGVWQARSPRFSVQQWSKSKRPEAMSSHDDSRTNTNKKSMGGLRLLEWTGKVVPQGPLVSTAKFGWKQTWKILMQELAPQSKSGEYRRPMYTFRKRLGDGEFPVEKDRYVLYVGNPCPWCHRVVLMVALKNLDSIIRVVQLEDDPERASRGGWVFQTRDPYFGCSDLRQVYDACVPGGYQGRCTAPLLCDVKTRQIVSNESSDILAMLHDINIQGVTSDIDLRPASILHDLEDFNSTLFDTVNNGVYKCGFSTEQAAYDAAYTSLYDTLTELDARLGNQKFLLGDRFTEADLRLFPTAARFDAVYATLFRCTRRWADFPHLQKWFVRCAKMPLPGDHGILLSTVDIDDCRRSYFQQLFPLNPSGIVPCGPTLKDLGLDPSDTPMNILAHTGSDDCLYYHHRDDHHE